MSDDYYDILGVDKNATQEEIKKKYKQLAKKHHPDLAGEGSDQEQFKKISNAYSVLGNKQKREQYDQFGSSAFGGQGQGQGFGQGFSGFSSSGQGGFGFDFSDLFEDDIFSQFTRGRGRRRGQESQEDLSLVHRIEIDFEEAYKGTKKKVELSRDIHCEDCDGTGSKSKEKTTCDKCNGRGRVITSRRTPFGMFSVENVCDKCKGTGEIVTDPCKTCNGRGYVRGKKKLEIEIPSGINNNDVIRIKDQGHQHKNNVGDLFIHVTVKSHDFFTRDAQDMHCEIPLAYTDMVLGTNIKLNVFGDKVKLKIPSGTQTNTVFRLKGKGFSDVNRRSGSGSLYVKVITEVPESLTKEYKKMLKDLADIEEKTVKKDIHKRYKDYIKQ